MAPDALDLSFGFNDPNFSDRTLLLEIIGDSDDNSSDHSRNVNRRCLNNRSTDTTLSTPSQVKAIHINSLILAGRSPFFRKLFSNGMQESEQKIVTLQIGTLEEDSFMALMKYAYSSNLPTTLDALLDLSMTADKFEVDSCMKDCTRALLNLPMTCESASVYLDLPPCLLESLAVQPLINAAKKFLVEKFKILSKCDEEFLNLPLLGIQAILSNDNLRVTSEFEVYNLVLRWARKHYPGLKERRKILKKNILHLVRFPFMTTTELTIVQKCEAIDPKLASKIVIRAFTFKAKTPHQKRRLAAEKGNQYVERDYKCLPVKVVELMLPRQQCIVYLHFDREKLERIYPNDAILSEAFDLGGRELALAGKCFKASTSFWLLLIADGSATYTVNYDIQLLMTPFQEFKSWTNGSHTFTESESCKFLKNVSWTEFIGDGNTYFINGILHVRAVLTAME